MENLNQIESEILNKIKNVKIAVITTQSRVRFLVKKESLQSFLKKLAIWMKTKEKNMLQNLIF